MRRFGRRSLGAALAVLTIGILASGCDWYQFGYVSGHTGDNALDTTITTSNASSLTLKYTATTGATAPLKAEAVVNGVLYASDTSALYAFSADGTTDCSGTPISCSPLWTASLGGATGGSLAVINGIVYAGGGSALEAFDAAGHTNCSGTPTVCQPLWQAPTPGLSGVAATSPTVSNGFVFVNLYGIDLEAFDANGVTNCSGSPKVCAPVWVSHISPLNIPVAVAGGYAYAEGAGGWVYALDATGTNGCSGAPKVCAPLWQYSGLGTVNALSVSGSTLYIQAFDSVHGSNSGWLQGYDAKGINGCVVNPPTLTTCSPLWAGAVPAKLTPMVGNGVVFEEPAPGITSFKTFDANGVTNCSGSPVRCAPLWSASIPANPDAIGGSVLYAHDATTEYAFDATGTSGCGGSPITCAPLWSSTTPNVAIADSFVANGKVYVGAQDSVSNLGEVLVYGLP